MMAFEFTLEDNAMDTPGTLPNVRKGYIQHSWIWDECLGMEILHSKAGYLL
jgi:hypothetical protein